MNAIRTSVAAVCACAVLSWPAASRALDPSNTPSPVTGNATWFTALGAPYGGCGLPQAALDTQNFVALNVYNTPGDYTFYPRPLTGANLAKMGMWNNGHNCGRWVQVTIGDNCTGVNDGAPNQPFCRNGSWVSDGYNGATLNMIVADSCGDSNAWCRDDPYHLDLAQAALNLFLRAGVPVGDLYPSHWNNRHITWQFIPAPNYTGDINIGFLQGAQTWWGAIAVSHLPNGIHSVEYLQNGVWTAATMNGDMGQSFIVAPLVAAGTQFQIRVRDVSDALLNGGRVYTFSLPSSCSPQCSAAYTQVAYTTSSGTTTQYALAVTRAGAGSGTVTSTPAGVSCGATCSASYDAGTVVTLSAAAASGSTFAGWSGGCTGTAATCTVTLSAAQSVTATFNGSTVTSYTLTVAKAGTGSGTVTSSVGGVSCGATCSAALASGTAVTLTAAAASGSTFAGWSGACTGTGTCLVTMTANRAVTATFNASTGTTYALTVTKSGTGSGTVTSSAGGIACGATCSANLASGTTVTLTATAASGSTFAGWSGACTGTAATCTVSMTAARAVTATFNTSGGGTAPCANPVTFTSQSGNFNTAGAICLRTSATVNGWGCSNFDGRTVSVNGGTATGTCGAGPLPLAKYTDGYTYFSVTAGTYSWASLYTW
jgi:hypothetical protein